MNLNQLRYFATVAQLNNLSKAAEILGVNQPALSKSINNLEEELNVKLFDRTGKKIVLNAQGERFLKCVSEMYANLEEAKIDISRMMGNESTYIHLGIAGCSEAFIRLASDFGKNHPECNFDFDFELETQDNPDIKNYDILVFPDENKFSKFSGYPIEPEKYLLAVSKEHPLAEYPIISTKLLENQDIVFMKNNNQMDFSYQICKALDLKFHSVSFTNTRLSQLQMIETGTVIGIIPDGISGCIDSNKFCLIPFINKNFSRKMMVSFRREKYLSRTAQEFKAAVMAYFGITEE